MFFFPKKSLAFVQQIEGVENKNWKSIILFKMPCSYCFQMRIWLPSVMIKMPSKCDIVGLMANHSLFDFVPWLIWACNFDMREVVGATQVSWDIIRWSRLRPQTWWYKYINPQEKCHVLLGNWLLRHFSWGSKFALFAPFFFSRKFVCFVQLKSILLISCMFDHWFFLHFNGMIKSQARSEWAIFNVQYSLLNLP